jgi:hypothetical protein
MTKADDWLKNAAKPLKKAIAEFRKPPPEGHSPEEAAHIKRLQNRAAALGRDVSVSASRFKGAAQAVESATKVSDLIGQAAKQLRGINRKGLNRDETNRLESVTKRTETLHTDVTRDASRFKE